MFSCKVHINQRWIWRNECSNYLTSKKALLIRMQGKRLQLGRTKLSESLYGTIVADFYEIQIPLAEYVDCRAHVAMLAEPAFSSVLTCISTGASAPQVSFICGLCIFPALACWFTPRTVLGNNWDKICESGVGSSAFVENLCLVYVNIAFAIIENVSPGFTNDDSLRNGAHVMIME
ncbi:hypothetical protein BJV82DRAFT_574117 [Fennellomyces sp. T-0311]|nr:hypothetical protein BJV82DRAFT_574117 [Fennellomyces sp. T-0311]